jgi:hypothetical protein
VVGPEQISIKVYIVWQKLSRKKEIPETGEGSSLSGVLSLLPVPSDGRSLRVLPVSITTFVLSFLLALSVAGISKPIKTKIPTSESIGSASLETCNKICENMENALYDYGMLLMLLTNE